MSLQSYSQKLHLKKTSESWKLLAVATVRKIWILLLLGVDHRMSVGDDKYHRQDVLLASNMQLAIAENVATICMIRYGRI